METYILGSGPLPACEPAGHSSLNTGPKVGAGPEPRPGPRGGSGSLCAKQPTTYWRAPSPRKNEMPQPKALPLFLWKLQGDARPTCRLCLSPLSRPGSACLCVLALSLVPLSHGPFCSLLAPLIVSLSLVLQGVPGKMIHQPIDSSLELHFHVC